MRLKIEIFGKLPFCALVPDSLDEKLNTFPPASENDLPPNIIRTIVTFKEKEIHSMLCLRKQVGTPRLPYETILPIEDLFGEWVYSVFAIAIASPYSNDLLEVLPSDTQSQDWIDGCTDFASVVIHKFVQSYRYETKKHWIPLPLKSRMSPWRVILARPESGIQPTESQIDYRGTGQLIGGGVSEDEFKAIEHNCCFPLAFRHAYEFMEMANRFKMTGDYQASIVYMAFHSESWVYHEVRESFKKNGKSNHEIEAFFRRRDGTPKSITAVIRDFLGKNAFDVFEKTKAYTNWRTQVADLRNSIAHGKSLSISKEQSQDGTNAVIEFRDYLLKNHL